MPSFGRLVILDAASRSIEEFDINKNPFIIGRASSCDVRLKQRQVSRQHAVVRVGDDLSANITSLGRLPVLVNGTAAIEATELLTGDIIEVQLEGDCQQIRFEGNDETIFFGKTTGPLNQAQLDTAPVSVQNAEEGFSAHGEAVSKCAAAQNPQAPPPPPKPSTLSNKVPAAPPPPAPPLPGALKAKVGTGLAISHARDSRPAAVQGTAPRLSEPQITHGERTAFQTSENGTKAVQAEDSAAGGSLVPTLAALQSIRAGLRKVRRQSLKQIEEVEELLLTSPAGKDAAASAQAKRKSVRFVLPSANAGDVALDQQISVQGGHEVAENVECTILSSNPATAGLTAASSAGLSPAINSSGDKSDREALPLGSPEGVATDATCLLPRATPTAAVRIEADSTLDFSVWAMGTAAEATTNLAGLQLSPEENITVAGALALALGSDEQDARYEDTAVLPLPEIVAKAGGVDSPAEELTHALSLAEHPSRTAGDAALLADAGAETETDGRDGDVMAPSPEATAAVGQGLSASSPALRVGGVPVEAEASQHVAGNPSPRSLAAVAAWSDAVAGVEAKAQDSLGGAVSLEDPVLGREVRVDSGEVAMEHAVPATAASELEERSLQLQALPEGPPSAPAEEADVEAGPNPQAELKALRAELSRAKRASKFYYTKMKLMETNLKRTSNQNVLLRRRLQQLPAGNDQQGCWPYLPVKIAKFKRSRVRANYKASVAAPLSPLGPTKTPDSRNPASDRGIITGQQNSSTPGSVQNLGAGNVPASTDDSAEAALDAGMAAALAAHSPASVLSLERAHTPTGAVGSNTAAVGSCSAGGERGPGGTPLNASSHKGRPGRDSNREKLLHSVLRGSVEAKLTGDLPPLPFDVSPAAAPSKAALASDSPLGLASAQISHPTSSPAAQEPHRKSLPLESLSVEKDLDGQQPFSQQASNEGEALPTQGLEALAGQDLHVEPTTLSEEEDAASVSQHSEGDKSGAQHDQSKISPGEPAVLSHSQRVTATVAASPRVLVGGTLDPIAEEQEEACTPSLQGQSPQQISPPTSQAPAEPAAHRETGPEVLRHSSGNKGDAARNAGTAVSPMVADQAQLRTSEGAARSTEGRSTPSQAVPKASQSSAERATSEARDLQDSADTQQQRPGTASKTEKKGLSGTDQDSLSNDADEAEGDAQASVEQAEVVIALEDEEGEEDEDDSCYICAKSEIGDTLLICDQCEQTAHLECAGLKKVPKGDWFCQHCKPQKALGRPKAAGSKQRGKENTEATASQLSDRSRRSTRKRAHDSALQAVQDNTTAETSPAKKQRKTTRSQTSGAPQPSGGVTGRGSRQEEEVSSKVHKSRGTTTISHAKAKSHSKASGKGKGGGTSQKENKGVQQRGEEVAPIRMTRSRGSQQ